MRSAGIYIRVSTERQAQEGYSIAAQKSNLVNFANNNNFSIYDIYSDEGISGKTIEGRPSVIRLIKDIQNKKIDVLLIQKFDRLTRNLSDTDDFIKLFQKYDVDVWSISDGKVDIGSSNGKFMTLLKGLFAQHERELTAERIRIAFKQKAKQGYTLCCGCAPYGYDRKKGNKIIVVNPIEARIVRKIFKMYINDNSFTTIANRLNMEGISTKKRGKTISVTKGKQCNLNKAIIGLWSAKTVRMILSNPVYIGKVRYAIGRADYYIGEGCHKPIISDKLWNEAQDKLLKIKAKARTNRPKEDVYFCGTLICGVCGKKLTTSRTTGRLRKDGTRNLFTAYRCVNKEKQICTARYVSHIKVEDAFVEYLENNIAEFDDIGDITVDELDIDLEEINDIKRLLAIKRTKQKEVMNLFLMEKIDYSQFKYMNEELGNIIKANESRLFYLEQDYIKRPDINISDISKNVVDHWRLLNDKEKLYFLNEFVESITIINRDIDRHNGKAEILDVKFYDYKNENPSNN